MNNKNDNNNLFCAFEELTHISAEKIGEKNVSRTDIEATSHRCLDFQSEKGTTSAVAVSPLTIIRL
jgi:hypothetical protein